MTLSVALCDDDKRLCTELENTLGEILSRQNIAHEITKYFSGEEILNKIKQKSSYDLIFLDIELSENGLNGVDVGNLLRANGDNCAIVYISWQKKYSMDLHEIRPLNFLIKPLTPEKIEKTIKTYLQLYWHKTNDFSYKMRQDTFKVSAADIVYLESTAHKLTLHLKCGSKQSFYGTLKVVYHEQLDKLDFLFIHASYAVNFDYISAFRHDKVELNYGNTILPVSRQRKKDAKEKYMLIMEKRRGF